MHPLVAKSLEDFEALPNKPSVVVLLDFVESKSSVPSRFVYAEALEINRQLERVLRERGVGVIKGWSGSIGVSFGVNQGWVLTG